MSLYLCHRPFIRFRTLQNTSWIPTKLTEYYGKTPSSRIKNTFVHLGPISVSGKLLNHNTFSVRSGTVTIVPDFLLLLSQWHVNCFQQVCNHSAPKGTSFRIIAVYSRIGETRQTTATKNLNGTFSLGREESVF